MDHVLPIQKNKIKKTYSIYFSWNPAPTSIFLKSYFLSVLEGKEALWVLSSKMYLVLIMKKFMKLL